MRLALEIARASFAANMRRPGPWAAAAVFMANAILWWAAGPAISRGWAVNSEFFIIRIFSGFTFMTLPFFVAVLVGDSMTRDWESRLSPLLLTTSLTARQYVAGKFIGAFALLLCAEAALPVTLCLLQTVRIPGMIVLAPRILPYATCFLLIIVISSALIAACCFAIGSLTYNSRLVYGAIPAAYGLYVAWQLSMKRLPAPWRIALDPLLMNWPDSFIPATSPAALNAMHLALVPAVVANRLAVLVAAAALVLLVSRLIPSPERLEAKQTARSLIVLNLGEAHATPGRSSAPRSGPAFARIALEFRLLAESRGVVPLMVATAVLFAIRSSETEVAAAALIIMSAVALFFVGESLHREEELGVAPLVSSTAISNAAVILPSALVIFGFTAALGAIAMRSPAAALLIAIPNAILLVSAALLLHTSIAEKHAAYAAGLAIAGALIFLVTHGSDHWSYNLVLHGRWTANDLHPASPRFSGIVLHRAYTLATAGALVALSHVLTSRRCGRSRFPALLAFLTFVISAAIVAIVLASR